MIIVVHVGCAITNHRQDKYELIRQFIFQFVSLGDDDRVTVCRLLTFLFWSRLGRNGSKWRCSHELANWSCVVVCWSLLHYSFRLTPWVLFPHRICAIMLLLTVFITGLVNIFFSVWFDSEMLRIVRVLVLRRDRWLSRGSQTEVLVCVLCRILWKTVLIINSRLRNEWQGAVILSEKKTSSIHFDIKRQSNAREKKTRWNWIECMFCCVPAPNDFLWILCTSTRYADLRNCVVSMRSLIFLLISCISVQSDTDEYCIKWLRAEESSVSVHN